MLWKNYGADSTRNIVKISIHAIGKPSDSWQIDALTDYQKRIEHFSAFSSFIYPTPKRNRNASVTKLMEKESACLLSDIPHCATVVLLDESGKTMTSPQLSDQLVQWRLQAKPVAFILGGPDGHHALTRQHAHSTLSLSSLTLPHLLARILLYEQIYRAFTLSNNHPYHR